MQFLICHWQIVKDEAGRAQVRRNPGIIAGMSVQAQSGVRYEVQPNQSIRRITPKAAKLRKLMRKTK